MDRDIFLESNVQSLKLDSGLLFTYVAEDVFIVSAFQEGKSLKPIYIEIFFTIGLKTQRSYESMNTKGETVFCEGIAILMNLPIYIDFRNFLKVCVDYKKCFQTMIHSKQINLVVS